MKKSLFTGFLVALLSLLITISYQNCGEVGGSSPFDVDKDIDDDDGDGNSLSGNLLALSFASNPVVQNNVLSASFQCDYRPFAFNTHVVSIQVSGTGTNGQPYNLIWSTTCTGQFFTITRTLSGNYNPANSYTVTATLTGLSDMGVVTGGAGSIASAVIGQGTIYPTSTTVLTQNFSTLVESGNYRELILLNDVPANYYAYTALRGKLEFTVNTALPLTQQFGIFEFLPYSSNTSPFVEYATSVQKVMANTLEQHQFIQSGVANGLGALQNVPTTSTDTRRSFQVGQTYVIDFVFNKNGSYLLSLYNKANPSVNLYYGNASLEGFDTGSFGTERIYLRLGSSINLTPLTGIGNISLKYRACGYVNNIYDTACINNAL